MVERTRADGSDHTFSFEEFEGLDRRGAADGGDDASVVLARFDDGTHWVIVDLKVTSIRAPVVP
jgi:hypothetical protein